jgi:toxin ParE1/3/4
MRRFFLSPAAKRDIASILHWTDDNFGEQARQRYEALLAQAILDVAEEPERLGVVRRIEISPVARTYHLRYSRNHAKTPAGKVKQPRHFLLFRVSIDGEVEFARVLHESMDIEQHLPDEYRRGVGGGETE